MSDCSSVFGLVLLKRNDFDHLIGDLNIIAPTFHSFCCILALDHKRAIFAAELSELLEMPSVSRRLRITSKGDPANMNKAAWTICTL